MKYTTKVKFEYNTKIVKELKKSFKHPSTTHPGWFRIMDNKTNEKLTLMFGIYSDSPVFVYAGMNIKFDWNTESWLVQ